MRNSGKAAVSAHRERLRRQGLVRIELRVRKEDAALLRRVAVALTDASHREEARSLLRDHFGRQDAKGLKALLAAAPFGDIELDRPRDTGRAVDL